MPREHLGGRRAEGHAVDVPSPLTDRRPHPDRTDRGRHPVGMGHGARLDGAGDAVGDGLDRPERGRQLVVVAGVGGVHRHRPPEDRLLRVDRVGDARVHQPIARQVLVGVHVAGRHQRLGITDHPRPGCTARSSSHGPTSTMTSPRTATAAIAHHRCGRRPSSPRRRHAPARPHAARRRTSRSAPAPCTIPRGCHTMPHTGPEPVTSDAPDRVLCANPALRDAWYAVARSIDVGSHAGGSHAARHACRAVPRRRRRGRRRARPVPAS